MTFEMPRSRASWDQNGGNCLPIRVHALGITDLIAWLAQRSGSDVALAGVALADVALEVVASPAVADCLFADAGDASVVFDDRSAGLPFVLCLSTGSQAIATMLDRADAIILPDDDDATIAQAFADVVGASPVGEVRELSDGASPKINALSLEAGRIADALARLAGTADPMADAMPVDAALVRRLLRLRRDRGRFLPADIFADPAWDMLLDLAAARLEGRAVPVSSLCIAAAVPTTTALRWVRSLPEAGLFVRRADPGDARRSHISLSDDAASAVLAWLRLFSSQFVLR